MKRGRNMNRKIRIITAVLCLIITAEFMNQADQYIKAAQTQQEIAGKILRFHVRANSDSDADQNLKLKVRDAIGSQMSLLLADATDLEECEQIVDQNMSQIVGTARTTISENGYNYPVQAYLADVDFPVKTYGEYTFPAGNYQALEVVIGAGAGRNWWCVMYPNMCFSGSVYEVVEDDAKESLEQTLTPKEYKALIEEKDYKIQCKYLTFLNKYLDK